jgi:acyl-CoA synthetase (AMP-forming)/AMP-acid ligase II
MFDWRLAHDPESVLVLTPDGAGRSYAELSHRADVLADTLAAAGVRRGDAVGLYLSNEPAWIVALFACWRLGTAAACVGALTPATEAKRRLDLVKAAHVVTSVPDSGLAGAIPVSSEGIVAHPAPEAGKGKMARPAPPAPEDIGVILFTSGTTGEPKAVPRPHSAIADAPRVTAGAYAKTSDFRARTAPPNAPPALSFNPFGHSAALGRMVFRMYVGRAMVVIPKFDVETLAQIAPRYNVDTLQMTPAMIHALAFTDLDIKFKALKYVNSGTAPLAVATRERFEQRYGAPVLQAYGSTEGAVTALERYDDVMAGRRGRGSVGRIAEGKPWRIVDSAGRDVARGAEGELLGRLEHMDPKAPNPQVDKEGWFHTGDLARMDEHGILYITGRLKEMMIVGGFNVYPGEVEEVLVHAPGVRDAVVVAFPDERLGEVPVAGLLWDNGIPESEREAAWRGIAEKARGALEAYKIPRWWFTLAEMPRNATGKVDRRAALALAGEAQAQGKGP